VLKQTPLGEADRILSIFTPDLGKIRAVARGVRRTKSKLAGHLEPLCHVSISLSRGRSLDAISEAMTIRSFRAVREDLQRLSEGVYLAELVESFSAEQQPSPAIYRLLLDTLEQLSGSESTAQAIRYFEVQIIGRSGFGPELRQCVECHTTLEPGDYVHSSATGGVLCDACKTASREVLLPLSLNANKVLRLLQRADIDGAVALQVPRGVADETDRLLRSYIRYVLERELKSVEFMDLVSRR
jgi:DNA repair protein RecO (recombination protein O)